jgi:hypothetical protein
MAAGGSNIKEAAFAATSLRPNNSSFLEVLVAEIIGGWHKSHSVKRVIDSNFLSYDIRPRTHRPGLVLVWSTKYAACVELKQDQFLT